MSSPDLVDEEGEPEYAKLVGVMRMAEVTVEVLCDADKGARLLVLNKLAGEYGVAPAKMTELMLALESDIAETAKLLNIELPAGQTHHEILTEARQHLMAISLGQQVELKQSRRENQVLLTKATTDKLTGLANRACFDAEMEKGVEAHRSGEVPGAFGLLIMDIDHFKKFNDTHGHQAGDEVLRHVGQVLTSFTRPRDMPARYGGEEFAVIVRAARPATLRTVAERVRAAVEELEVEFQGTTLRVTMSVGGACMTGMDGAADIEHLIELADKRLYIAKENGRNRIEVAPDVLQAKG
jgi:diguanylate cyclase (GGDEF)-like protein